MDARNQKRWLIFSIIATGALASGYRCFVTCFGADKGTAAASSGECRKSRTFGRRHPRKYYAEAAKIADEITSVHGAENRVVVAPPVTGEKIAVARRLLESLLSRTARPPEIRADDLFIMHLLAGYVVCDIALPPDERRRNAQVLCMFLGEVRKERVPNFKWRIVTMNVAPPLGVAGPFGMDPKAIDDPVARAKYEEAIRENQRNAIWNMRQQKLQEIDRYLRKPIIVYVAKAFRGQVLRFETPGGVCPTRQAFRRGEETT